MNKMALALHCQGNYGDPEGMHQRALGKELLATLSGMNNMVLVPDYQANTTGPRGCTDKR
jgi:hypothetical protein